MEYYLVIKKEILLFATTQMDPESMILSEISQRKTNTIWFHSYVISNEQSKLTKQRQTHRQTAGWQLWGVGRLEVWVWRDDMLKGLFKKKMIKTMNNKMAKKYISTIENKKQTKQTRAETESWIPRGFWWLPDGRGLGTWVKR